MEPDIPADETSTAVIYYDGTATRFTSDLEDRYDQDMVQLVIAEGVTDAFSVVVGTRNIQIDASLPEQVSSRLITFGGDVYETFLGVEWDAPSYYEGYGQTWTPEEAQGAWLNVRVGDDGLINQSGSAGQSQYDIFIIPEYADDDTTQAQLSVGRQILNSSDFYTSGGGFPVSRDTHDVDWIALDVDAPGFYVASAPLWVHAQLSGTTQASGAASSLFSSFTDDSSLFYFDVTDPLAPLFLSTIAYRIEPYLLRLDTVPGVAGSEADDMLTATPQSDLVDAKFGDDTITGRFGNDTVLAGDGHDSVDGGLGWDWIEGGMGNDSLSGASGWDTVFGEDGDDMLYGQAGPDELDGGAGADTLIGGINFDTLNGGAGDDLLHGNNGDDNLRGNAGADTLNGNAGADFLNGGAGNDMLTGGINTDRLFGGAGDDTLLGQAGADELVGGVGSDLLVGGTGNDTLRNVSFQSVNDDDYDSIYVYGGNDTMFGGGGADTFAFREKYVNDPISEYNLPIDTGHYTIADFQPGIDTLAVTRVLASAYGADLAGLQDAATLDGDQNLMLTFEMDSLGGYTTAAVLVFEGISSLDQIADDIQFI